MPVLPIFIWRHAYRFFRSQSVWLPFPLADCGDDGLAVVGANGPDTGGRDSRGIGGGRVLQLQVEPIPSCSGEPVETDDALQRSCGYWRGVGCDIALGTATRLLAQTGCSGYPAPFIGRGCGFRGFTSRAFVIPVAGWPYQPAPVNWAFDLAVDLIGSRGLHRSEVCRHATVEGQRSGSNRQTGPSGLAFAGVSDKLAMGMRIMEENVEIPLSMSEVADRVGISRRQLERLFAIHIGQPPARHYLRVRVDQAKRLIEGTRMPIIDIAIACGFMSASHFAKCFRIINGFSPQQCRTMVPAWVGPGLG